MDIGSLGLQISIFCYPQSERPTLQVISHKYSTEISGNVIDTLLFAELQKKYGISNLDPSTQAAFDAQIRHLARQFKQDLLQESSATDKLELFDDPIDITLTRERFHQILTDAFSNKIDDLVHESVETLLDGFHRSPPVTISPQLHLMGGSSRIPVIHSLLEQSFQKWLSDPTVKVLTGQIQKESVAVGSAIYGTLMTRYAQNVSRLLSSFFISFYFLCPNNVATTTYTV